MEIFLLKFNIRIFYLANFGYSLLAWLSLDIVYRLLGNAQNISEGVNSKHILCCLHSESILASYMVVLSLDSLSLQTETDLAILTK